jgi:EAL domain-containing protein (putative c-di-GMP-specific phosphodiesterase class I)
MVDVEPLPFVIGRDEDCDLKLIDKRISRHHSEIRKSGDMLWIRDLGSTNGTYVNHVKIRQAELLEPEDLISVGNFKFYIKRAQTSEVPLADKTYAMDISEELKYMESSEPKLKALISERAVIPYFQPIMSLSGPMVVGYEILGRIVNQDLPSNPAELLELAKWLGYDIELSSLFREVGVETGKNLPGSPMLFVNTASSEVYQVGNLLKSLEKIHEIAPMNKIILEINEKATTGEIEMTKLRSGLEKLNFGLAFDDFGAGQSRLAELANVPPDYLKFDASLIHHIHLAPKRLHQMVSTFVNAAQDLGIATLAEGIECSDEADTCRQLGFNFAQGYYYGRPLPISEIKFDS